MCYLIKTDLRSPRVTCPVPVVGMAVVVVVVMVMNAGFKFMIFLQV